MTDEIKLVGDQVVVSQDATEYIKAITDDINTRILAVNSQIAQIQELQAKLVSLSNPVK